jgi:hypothetical protein
VTARPWLKWYPGDWRADPLLRSCEPVSRYVWLEMIGLMHEAEPYGHLVLAGRAMDYKTLSRVIGVDQGDVKRAVKELEDRGVLSRNDSGVIFSRRMIRDENRRETLQKNGSKGGNPRLKKQELSGGLDNQEANQEDKPQKPEARNQEHSEDKSSGGEPPDPLKELFDVGVSVLTAAGHSERQARSLIGKWRKHGEEQVLTALIACKTKSISNPVEWITKSLNGSSGYVSESGYHYRGSEDQVLRQAEARADWNTYWSIKKKAAVHAQA